MKSELIQAGYGLDSYQEWIQITDEWIQIQKDGNLDGDLGDSREELFTGSSRMTRNYLENHDKAISRSS